MPIDKATEEAPQSPIESPESDNPRIPAAHYLVLCGAISAQRDSWFSGDFFGMYKAYQVAGLRADFINCFPIDEYFAIGRYKDIKFSTGSTRILNRST